MESAVLREQVQSVCDQDYENILRLTRPARDKIVKFAYFDERVSFKVFLMKKVLPEGMDSKLRRSYAEHSELHNVEWFPYAFSCVNGKRTIFEIANKTGQFRIEYMSLRDKDQYTEQEWKDYDENPPSFQLSERIYALAPSIETDEGEMEYFLDVERDGVELFKELKAEIQYHVDIDDWCSSLIALWIMSTHMFQLWSAFPYFFILAERGSGKSRLLKFMSMVCSMGQYWVSPRASPMFRSVEALQPTLCLDETEMLNDEDQAELVNLLNAGYERGAKVPRTNSEKMVVEFFDAYCPKALASTKPPSTVLESRCLKVPIRRTQRLSEFVRRDPALKRKYLETLKKNICYWSIDNGSKIASQDMDIIYSKYSERFQGVPARALQIMAPILSLYEYLGLDDEGEAENLQKIIGFQAAEQKTSSVNDSDQRIIVALYQVVNKGLAPITTKLITEEMGLEDDEKKYYSSQRIGNVLKTLHVPSKMIDGRKQYMRDMDPTQRYEFVKQLILAYSIEVSNIGTVAGVKQQTMDVEIIDTKKVKF